jgi:HSP20 family protein
MTKREWLPKLWRDWDGEDEGPFTALRKQIDTLFEDFDEKAFLPMTGVKVRTNVSETEKEIRLTAELPGIEMKDVSVEVVGDRITIKGEKKSEKDEKVEEEGRTFHRVERTSGAFERMMRLPFEIDPKTVVADVKNGVLTVLVPKPAKEVKPVHKVEIKAA